MNIIEFEHDATKYEIEHEDRNYQDEEREQERQSVVYEGEIV